MGAAKVMMNVDDPCDDKKANSGKSQNTLVRERKHKRISAEILVTFKLACIS